MRTRLRHIWEWATSGYLFLPVLMTLAAVALSIVTSHLDRRLPLGDPDDLFYSGGADPARDLLSTVAGSIITVTGVVFSITVVALTQASNQFGPRLMRTFMRDRISQVVLGLLVATYLYSLLVLRAIRSETHKEFIPHIGITASLLLAMAGVGGLVYFIHHLAVSLQASMIIATISRELRRSVDALCQDAEEAGTSDPHDGAKVSEMRPSAAIRATADGYIQAIEYAVLVNAAADADMLVRLDRRPGDHIIAGALLMEVCNAKTVTQGMEDRLQSAVIVGRTPTSEQDVEYGIGQLVEVAVRALSSGVNDPFTAINCVDALGSELCRISGRGLPPGIYRDRAGMIRVVSRCITLTGLIDAAFTQIRQYAQSTPSVLIRMLDVFTEMSVLLQDDGSREALLHHAAMVHQDGCAHVSQVHDRNSIQERYERAVAALSGDVGKRTAFTV